ncbi:MAG: hypothetical protein ACOYN4_00395 [Bacteroidales bacterium]
METKPKLKNFQDLAQETEDILLALKEAKYDAKKIKEQVNAVGKLTNIYKYKLEYNLNRAKLDQIDFFEDNKD